jgi:hypothetical protein
MPCKNPFDLRQPQKRHGVSRVFPQPALMFAVNRKTRGLPTGTQPE